MLTKLLSKSTWLTGAEIIDAFRLFPRGVMCYIIWEVYTATLWYRTLETPTAEQTAYVGLLWTGFAAALKFYNETGRDWSLAWKSKSFETKNGQG